MRWPGNTRAGSIPVNAGIWLDGFIHYDLGYFDRSRKPCNPSTTRSALGCHPLPVEQRFK
jgi:hypothetical protein